MTDRSRPFDAIFFDLGNTLFHFDGNPAEVNERAYEKLVEQLHQSGIRFDRHKFLSRFRVQLEAYHAERETEFIERTTAYILSQTLTEFGYPDPPDRVLRAAVDSMYSVSQEHWLPEEEAVPVLENLREQGYRLAAISNAADDGDVQALVDKAGIRPYFEVILSSATAGIRKPNPRIFQIVLDHMQVEPGRAAMVGDTLGADILGGINAGIFTIWITRRADKTANRAHLDTIQPDAVIENLDDLLILLQNSLRSNRPQGNP